MPPAANTMPPATHTMPSHNNGTMYNATNPNATNPNATSSNHTHDDHWNNAVEDLNHFLNDTVIAIRNIQEDIEQIDSKIETISSRAKDLMLKCFTETSTPACLHDLNILKDQIENLISFVFHLDDHVHQPAGMVKKMLAQNADLPEVKGLSKITKKLLIQRERDIVHAQVAKNSASSNKLSKLKSYFNDVEKEITEKIDEFERYIDEKLQMMREKLDKKN